MMPEPQTLPLPSGSASMRRFVGLRLRQWHTRALQSLRVRRAPRQKRTWMAIFREWHKRVGLFAFVFMGWLGLSGFLINQSASWGYDTARIDWGWVMSLYGLHAEAPPTGYVAGGHWLAVTSDYTLLDAEPLAQAIVSPLGLVAGGTRERPLLFVATDSSLVMLTADGERYDELRSPVLPVSSVRRIGRTVDGGVAVQDLDAFASVDNGDTWAPVDPGRVNWSTPTALSNAQRERLRPYSRPSVSLEHVLVDLHSGRLFGGIGAWIINLVGLGAIWLAFSGMWMWWRIQRNRRTSAR